MLLKPFHWQEKWHIRFYHSFVLIHSLSSPFLTNLLVTDVIALQIRIMCENCLW